jgi:hypothetical protein
MMIKGGVKMNSCPHYDISTYSMCESAVLLSLYFWAKVKLYIDSALEQLHFVFTQFPQRDVSGMLSIFDGKIENLIKIH